MPEPQSKPAAPAAHDPCDESLLLAEWIDRKFICLRRLEEIGQRQLSVIEEGNITGLLDLLAFKQQFLAQLQQIEQALKPFHHQNPAERTWPSEELRIQTGRRLEECRQMLTRIIEREQEGERRLAERRAIMSRQLERMQSAQKVHGAYQDHTGESLSSFDASCE